MKEMSEIDKLLKTIAPPSLKSGYHQEYLRQKLIRQKRLALISHPPFNLFELITNKPLIKALAVSLIAVGLFSTGWGAKQIISKIKYFTHIDVQPKEDLEFVFPNGAKSKIAMGSSISTEIPDQSMESMKVAQNKIQEIHELIKDKKYSFVKTFQDLRGVTQYVYKFTLKNGEIEAHNYVIPLSNVSSWEDYQKKANEFEKNRMMQIQKAISAGHTKLVNIDINLVHKCRERDTGKKINVQRIFIGKDKIIAHISESDNKNSSFFQESSWEDHLNEIKNGNRELLGIAITKEYSYDVILDDGSHTLFNYGYGDETLFNQ